MEDDYFDLSETFSAYDGFKIGVSVFSLSSDNELDDSIGEISFSLSIRD